MVELNNAIYNLKLSIKTIGIIESLVKQMEDFSLKDKYLEICELYKESLETVLKEVDGK